MANELPEGAKTIVLHPIAIDELRRGLAVVREGEFKIDSLEFVEDSDLPAGIGLILNGFGVLVGTVDLDPYDEQRPPFDGGDDAD